MALMNPETRRSPRNGVHAARLTYSYLSSKLVREIAQLGAPLTGLVPPIVEERLKAKVS